MSDTRSLRFKSSDGAQRWRVFHAVEEAAAHAASQQGLKTLAWVSVQHSSGDYTRDTVTEAKAVAERNGYKPSEIRFNVDYLNHSAEGAPYPWVNAELHSGRKRLISVEVYGRNELEANGTFALLESAVNQARKRPGLNYSGNSKWWTRLVNHPYSVQIIGGAIAALVVAVVTALWATLR